MMFLYPFLKRRNTSSYLRRNKSFGTKRSESCLCQLMKESLGRVKISQFGSSTFCCEQHILSCKQSGKNNYYHWGLWVKSYVFFKQCVYGLICYYIPVLNPTLFSFLKCISSVSNYISMFVTRSTCMSNHYQQHTSKHFPLPLISLWITGTGKLCK